MKEILLLAVCLRGLIVSLLDNLVLLLTWRESRHLTQQAIGGLHTHIRQRNVGRRLLSKIDPLVQKAMNTRRNQQQIKIERLLFNRQAILLLVRHAQHQSQILCMGSLNNLNLKAFSGDLKSVMKIVGSLHRWDVKKRLVSGGHRLAHRQQLQAHQVPEQQTAHRFPPDLSTTIPLAQLASTILHPRLILPAPTVGENS